MADRDNNVYKAKLAEQAERYDGELAEIVFLSLPGTQRGMAVGLEPATSRNSWLSIQYYEKEITIIMYPNCLKCC